MKKDSASDIENDESIKAFSNSSEDGPDSSNPATILTLQQKFVEMRKACPEIVKKKYSENVNYTFAKIYDVWEKITPIMNELGVDFDFIKEEATRHAENGDPVYWTTIQTRTSKGECLMFIYEADITIRWSNIFNEDDMIDVTVHAVGWNDDPAKAKGAAHTYAIKYYLFEKFTIDQGEDDPDTNNFGAEGRKSTGSSKSSGVSGKRLSEAQLKRLYSKARDAGMTEEKTKARILEKYKKEDPATLTNKEYDEICGLIDIKVAERQQKPQRKECQQGGRNDV